ncbi:hypothetical protein YERSI8AC_60203 [Enterobacterales bacterium 8AC]|nr:hypothetical protein YERSI8AC_60203 [Enterobacterales bacterium 8AC]
MHQNQGKIHNSLFFITLLMFTNFNPSNLYFSSSRQDKNQTTVKNKNIKLIKINKID